MAEQSLFGNRPIAGPSALLRNGMRMPPGMVVSHNYLIEDPPTGEWFVDAFPPARDEAFVRGRHTLFVEQVKTNRRVWVLATENGFLALPAHEEDRPVSMVFGIRSLAQAFSDEGRFDAVPEEISLDEFMAEYLPAKIEDENLIGTNWTPDLIGIEVEPTVIEGVLNGFPKDGV